MAKETGAKTADYQLGQFTYPRGWLMVASSASVTSVPSEGRFFGEDVVLYRGASGKVVMLDAYCPHMGAHLAVGASGATAQHCVQVVGDSIRCPNHGWIFGADGKCQEIPYSDITIPDTLRIKSWHVEETGGCVFVWHDEEGGAPTYELPAIPQWDDPLWICSPVEEMGVWGTHPMELASTRSTSPTSMVQTGWCTTRSLLTGIAPRPPATPRLCCRMAASLSV